MAKSRQAWQTRGDFFIGLTILLAAIRCTHGPVDLRVRNLSEVAIKNVVVIFPDARIEFGEIGPNETSGYHPVPGGVGEYASLDFSLGDRLIEQRVADFVGWKPLPGRAFTYEVKITEGKTEPFLKVARVVKER